MEEFFPVNAPKVEDYLRDINYSVEDNYVPSSFALEFVNFIKLVNGAKGEENKSPVVHYKMLDALVSSEKHICNMCSRGLAKTALLGEYLFLYLAVYGKLPKFGKVDYSLYVGDSIDNGVKKMRYRLERRYMNSEFLKTYVPTVKFTDVRWYFKNAAENEFVVSGFGAKTGVRGPLALNEKVYLDGKIKTIKDVVKGDWVLTPKGTFSEVIGKSDIVNERMYKLTFEDGRELKVSENHLNVLHKKKLNKLSQTNKVHITTKVLASEKLKGKYGWCYYMKLVEPAEYSHKDLVIDPYLLGLMLGDGCITDGKGVKIAGLPDDVSFYASQIKDKVDFSLYVQPDKRNNHIDLLRMSVHGINQEVKWLGLNGVKAKDKFIPEEYLFSSIEQRKALLSGLLDTDGAVNNGAGASYTTISDKLAEDIQELGRSLGMFVSAKRFERPGNRYPLWRLMFSGEENPFRLPSKANKWKSSERRHGMLALVGFEEIPQEPSMCILLDDPTHEFVTTGYIPTHNTVELNTRPQLAVLDDLISDEDARSDTVISSIEDTVYKAIEYALHPTKNKIIWSGTPFNARDPLYKAVESGAWTVNVYPICEEFPCSVDEFKSAWPDRFTYKSVKDKYEKALQAGKIETFNQELMLRIMSDEDRLIDDTDIVWFNRSRVLENKSNYNFYITTDFATSEKTSSDFSAISVWAYNNNGDWMWVDGVCKKQTMDKNIDELFRLVQEYNPLETGIEISGQQKGFVSWIQREMLNRNIFFSLASDSNGNNPGIRPTTQKLQRFNTVVPWFKQKKIWFPEELKTSDIMKEAINELSLISVNGFKSKHDDFIDTISMLQSLKAWKPSQVTAPKKEEDRYWLDYEESRDGTIADHYTV
jgi:predicted phage terminase large subunit-like protein